jgi:hypothetical protein
MVSALSTLMEKTLRHIEWLAGINKVSGDIQ